MVMIDEAESMHVATTTHTKVEIGIKQLYLSEKPSNQTNRHILMEYTVQFQRNTYKKNYHIAGIVVVEKHSQNTLLQIHLSQSVIEGTNLRIVKRLGVSDPVLDNLIGVFTKQSATLDFIELGNLLETFSLTL